ncbi:MULTISPECIES: imidazolonepropionase [unclassified Janthinobacterium]|uniref:imidazolonepropionase n=1 Tax=unclassified Janthinobacterium TaxID=2610881 RepID=UPI0008F4BBE0|nr:MULTISPECIES: imidazolonepropionase [unclassified Janthinobacterium]APA66748.1 imidazolonepropionase [Janthinobacterium sp. 1_2014MBL_MicDiv]MDN2708122.1 imidazolonepropionase [Janthinobacterium sp. SUN118]
MQDWDLVIHNVHLATMEHGYGELLDAAIAVKDGRIAWFGPGDELPASGAPLFDGQGCWLTPGLIDCHTHIVHAGNRSDEFEARLNGASYEDISRAGGGIMSTVRATRAASDEELLRQSLPRVLALLAEGVTTLEIKSGYGLAADSEAKMLRVARRIGQTLPVTVRTTFLGAHALPPEYAGQADAYIDLLCRQMLPALAGDGLVDAVDAFCERIGFTPAQTETVFEAARALNLPVKLHAEQLSDLGGAALVARYGGLSADHLEFLSDEGIAAMARHGTVAVLLPGAYYFLRETQPPPVAGLRAAGVPMAVSTDCNPGTSPMTSLLLAMNMACTLWRLTPQEALAGCTIHAARALGLQQETGSLVVGKRADFALWRIARPADLAYALGLNPCAGVVHGGVWRMPVVSLAD